MTRRGRPVVFGEVVFDLFPDGSEVLGGAPFNVAWHLKGLGERPLMITRIGDDQRGRAILDRMLSAGLDVAGVQMDEEHPTGTVRVLLDSAGPRFQIA
ncbi:MAG TPA: PfkB family carbohydrate kinase, partial [Acidobacteriota bacterium]|nr:PfkB family carbohydrate kinase [Acidobacteriota bacterium]